MGPKPALAPTKGTNPPKDSAAPPKRPQWGRAVALESPSPSTQGVDTSQMSLVSPNLLPPVKGVPSLKPQKCFPQSPQAKAGPGPTQPQNLQVLQWISEYSPKRFGFNSVFNICPHLQCHSETQTAQAPKGDPRTPNQQHTHQHRLFFLVTFPPSSTECQKIKIMFCLRRKHPIMLALAIKSFMLQPPKGV